jgi:5-methylcytosine-specific restriction endonuclease McrA
LWLFTHSTAATGGQLNREIMMMGAKVQEGVMWNEPSPKWRKAQKQYQCQGDGCAKVIAYGERYLDRALLGPEHNHLRYCQQCAGPFMAGADDYQLIRRNNFPDRYQERISGAQWKSLKGEIIEQRGNRCERCGAENVSLALHHLHYRSLGNEQPEDVELLCRECHTAADESR